MTFLEAHKKAFALIETLTFAHNRLHSRVEVLEKRLVDLTDARATELHKLDVATKEVDLAQKTFDLEHARALADRDIPPFPGLDGDR